MGTEAQVETQTKKIPIAMIIHTLIGVGLMFSGLFLPCLSTVAEPTAKLLSLGLPQVDGGVLVEVTRMGMIATMIFLGVVYLWTFVDTLWPGFLGLLMLIFCGYAPANQILSMFFGNPMVVMIFFLMIFASAIVHSNIAAWLARWLMTRDFIEGRPWVMTATLLVGTYCVSFLDQVTACFLMWPILFSIFEETGYKKGDGYVSIMTVYVVIAILCSFATDPFKGGAFYLLVNLQSLAAGDSGMAVPVLNTAAYLVFGVAVSLCSIAMLLLLMRFVFRVNVSPLLRLNVAALKKEPLPPMTANQKILLAVFFFYAMWLLLPSLIGKENAVGAFLTRNTMAGSAVAVLLICIIPVKGRPVADICVSNAVYPWRVFFLIAFAMLLGGAMTAKGTNVALLMECAMRSMLSGFSVSALTIAVILLGISLTNFCNSVVLGLVLTPVLLAVSHAFGFSAAPIMACFIFAVLIAACTPAASPFAALLFGNTKWVSKTDMIKHSVIASAVVAGVVIIVGMPLASLIFG